MSEQIEIYLDQVTCNGCGGCAELCPDIFGFDDHEEKAFVKHDSAASGCPEEASAFCPMDCIEIQPV